MVNLSGTQKKKKRKENGDLFGYHIVKDSKDQEYQKLVRKSRAREMAVVGGKISRYNLPGGQLGQGSVKIKNMQNQSL